jgi:hypothetical protein
MGEFPESPSVPTLQGGRTMVSDELENSRNKNLKTFSLCCRGEISAASAIALQAEKKRNRKIARDRRDSGDYRQCGHIQYLTFQFA